VGADDLHHEGLIVQFEAEILTGGDGLWSTVSKPVQVNSIEIAYVNEEKTFGELRVYFDTNSWDVDQDGLVYTDAQFLSQLRVLLTLVGLDGEDVSYSEQGMQGNDFVSFDVGADFLNSWLDLKTVIIQG